MVNIDLKEAYYSVPIYPKQQDFVEGQALLQIHMQRAPLVYPVLPEYSQNFWLRFFTKTSSPNDIHRRYSDNGEYNGEGSHTFHSHPRCHGFPHPTQ